MPRPTASVEREGATRRCFTVTEQGLEALRAHQRAYRELSAGLEDVLGEA